MHYVNTNGLELDTTTTLSAEQLAKTSGGIVKISDYTAEGTIDGYTFKQANLGKRTGSKAITNITGLKVKEGTTSGTYAGRERECTPA